ncbi:amidohydrolase family protein [Pinibacter aurantiacus]|uniref:Peptidase M19 n=1 Tax=Pinibacter aurantiacus TaxID=2851599 RepID=A0A9E2SFE8_9BACT|nr:hypothetical protein [Pinibacter aurantiacus]MBV4360493.1 hypothetical protein [Pinibacter aurantiacus]
MKSHFFVDMHCHPSIKAFARSFKKTPGEQSESPNDSTSIWHRDAPSVFDKAKNYVLGLTNFIQSDGNSLIQGRVAVVCLSFYPQEKGFFINKLGQGIESDTLTKLATEFGQQRIDHIQAMDSYWEDLKIDMNFLRLCENKEIKVNGKKVSYVIASSYTDIEEADKEGALGETKIVFVPTIEGAHVFDQEMNCYEPWNTYPAGVPEDKLKITLQRVQELREGKDGLIKPLFMTFAHHFWNGLSGHSESLAGIVRCVADQTNGMEQGLFQAGVQVIDAMLKDQTDEEGKSVPPIYIDVKHMSRQARLQYFDLLKNYPGKNIPVIVSHGGVTGLSSPGGQNVTPASQEGLYMTNSINFFDDEILKIEETNGVFGIQLDERRIGSKSELRKARGNTSKRDILYAWAKLVWNQVRHIAELLDMNGRYAWGIQSLGTDYDGIIDPINGYWTAKELDDLDDYLLMHVYNYLKGTKTPCPLQQERNKTVTPEEVVDRVMTSNALNLLSRIF